MGESDPQRGYATIRTMDSVVVPDRQTWGCTKCKLHTALWCNVCPACGHRYSFEPVLLPAEKNRGNIARLGSSPVDTARVKTRIKVIDDFLGGGFPRKLTTILFGLPSCGKSTLTLQLACASGEEVLYCTGEEKSEGIDARARRCGFDIPEKFFRMQTNDTDAALHAVRHQRPKLVILDSIQKIYSRKVLSRARGNEPRFIFRPGSYRQMLYLYEQFMAAASELDFALLIISHADERGGFRASMEFLHEVDSIVLGMKRNSDPENPLRALYVRKSRSCPEGVLHMMMTSKGLVPLTHMEAMVMMDDRAEARTRAGRRRARREAEEITARPKSRGGRAAGA